MKMEPAPAVPVYGIVVEKDVDVPMRDGARLKADVFRPDDAGKFPAILNLGPYQKDKLWVPPDTLEEKPNPLMNWETVNPQWWVPKGYAAVRVDGRGSGKSPGQCEPWSLAESIDFYDAIEWAAAQPWCNGQGRALRHILFRDQPVVRRQSAAAVAEGDHSLGRFRRPLPRRAVPWRHPQPVHAQLVRGAPDAPPRRPRLAASCRTPGRPTRCISGCTTTSTAAHSAARRRNGTRSRCRCSASATGPAWRCICAATPRLSCAPPPGTRSCASMPARTCIRSTPRRAGAISCASSTTGSRASTTASWTSRR